MRRLRYFKSSECCAYNGWKRKTVPSRGSDKSGCRNFPTDSLEGEIQEEDVEKWMRKRWNFSRMKNWKLYLAKTRRKKQMMFKQRDRQQKETEMRGKKRGELEECRSFLWEQRRKKPLACT